MSVLVDRPLPPFALEAGPRLPGLHSRVWADGPGTEALAGEAVDDPGPDVVVHRRADELASLWSRVGQGSRLDPEVPTVLVVHALTAGPHVGGPGGWWEPVVGPGRPLDTARVRVLCANTLGGCYGSFGASDPGFPRFSEAAVDDPTGPEPPPDWRAAPLTAWDAARALLALLDDLGLPRIDRVIGGSVGGMIALALQALAPDRVGAVTALATDTRATPWVLGWNHVGRRALLADPERGLPLARQLAHLSYRANPGLEQRQGRAMRLADWHPARTYAMGSYLDHHGRKLARRFTPAAYVAALDVMDHADVDRPPPGHSGPWRGVERLHDVTFVGIDTDQLYPPQRLRRLATEVRGARYRELSSPHGHDAFLLAWDALGRVLAEDLT